MKSAHRLKRLRALLEEKAFDAIIVHKNSNLIWLTAFEAVFDSEQAHVAYIDRHRCVLHTDSRYTTAMRIAAKNEGLWEINDEHISEAEFIAACVEETLSSELSSKVHDFCLALSRRIPLCSYRALCEVLSKYEGMEIASISDYVLRLRQIKDSAELEALKKAQRIADTAFRSFLEKIHVGMTEKEASLELEFALRQCGAETLSFPNIVASGPHSAMPHASPSTRAFEKGDFVVCDFGARVGEYCSDTTRTISIGTPTSERLSLYEAVLDANQQVRRSLRPGVTGKQMHTLALEVMAQHGYSDMMGHSLGHGVGIDIHELPALSLSNERALVEGNVVTVEPGIYIPGKCGVRIEDCGVITHNAYANFNDLPHTLIVVE